jgi:putative SOS response-associated peptidase YedK
MCGRYTIYQTGELANRFKTSQKELDKLLGELKAHYNAAPGQNLPVITEYKGRHLSAMRWGLIPIWAKDRNIGYKLINTRSETVFERPSWKRPILRQRCLVPSNGFYEWIKTDEGKQPYFIHPTDQELFSYAGIFDIWTDKETGEVIESFSILTTGPSKEMRDIHDRMPVILKPNDENRWLEPSNDTPESIADLLKPYDDGKLEVYPVSQDVNGIKFDEERLIHAMPESRTP